MPTGWCIVTLVLSIPNAILIFIVGLLDFDFLNGHQNSLFLYLYLYLNGPPFLCSLVNKRAISSWKSRKASWTPMDVRNHAYYFPRPFKVTDNKSSSCRWSNWTKRIYNDFNLHGILIYVQLVTLHIMQLLFELHLSCSGIGATQLHLCIPYFLQHNCIMYMHNYGAWNIDRQPKNDLFGLFMPLCFQLCNSRSIVLMCIEVD